MNRFAVAYLLVWAVSYMAVSLLAPEVGGAGDALSGLLYMGFGWLIVLAIVLSEWGKDPLKRLGYATLFVLGVMEVISGVASWTGVVVWNVPFPSKELFQVSMAFADLISAAVMFYVALEP